MLTLINWSFYSRSIWKCLLLKWLELHLDLQKTLFYKISKWCHYQWDPENPNSNPATNYRITFHLCSYWKLVSPIILHFIRINPLKSYEKLLNCSFGSRNIQILEENYEVENGIIMRSYNGLRKLLTLLFAKTRKTSLN